jgi:hypothetical protein
MILNPVIISFFKQGEQLLVTCSRYLNELSLANSSAVRLLTYERFETLAMIILAVAAASTVM